jgi:hypothetical protein
MPKGLLAKCLLEPIYNKEIKEYNQDMHH